MMLRWLCPGIALVLLVGVSAGCARTSGPLSDGRLHVVAAESPWGAVATAIGGNAASVVSVLSDPGIDPHEFVPSAQVAGEVALADVVIENGLGYDSLMDHLLGTGAAHTRTTVVAAHVLGVSGPDANPHLWYAVERVPMVASAIASTFEKADPSHASTYRHNLASFLTSLNVVTGQVAQLRASYGGDHVAQTERVAGYLLEEAGLVVVSPASFASAIEEGRDPTAADSQAMNVALANGGVRVLVVNSATQSKVTDRLVAQAQAHHIPVVRVSELVDPAGSSYVSWQHQQLDELQAALSGSAS